METIDSKGTVLIIDDTIAIIDMVKTALENNHYRVLIATSGIKGLKSAELAQPDLILLDILMPEMDGYETCEKLKTNTTTKNIPVIFMSALSDVFDKVKAFNIGAVDYITKPLNVEELLARVNTQTTLFQMQKKLTDTNIWLEEEVTKRTQDILEKNKELLAAEEELRASNDALKENIEIIEKNEQILKEKNEELQATEEELIASNDELKHNIEKLTESEFKLNEAQKLARLGHYSLAFDTGIWYSSSELNSIFGINESYSRTVEGWLQIVHPDFRQIMQNYFTNEIVTKHKPFDKEYKIINQETKQEAWVHGLGTLTFNESGQLKNMLGSIQDITHRKLTEIALTKSEERLSFALNATTDGLFDWNLITNEIYYSPRWKNMLGYTDSELPNEFSVWEKLTHPYDVKKAWNMLNAHIKGEIDRFELEFKMKHKKGYWKPILSRANALFDNSGKAIRLVGTHVDLTEIRAAENKLIESEQLLRESQAIGNIGSWEYNIKQDKLIWSDQVYKIFGVDSKLFDLTLENFISIVHPEDQTFVHASYEQSIKNNDDGYEIEHRIIKKDSQEIRYIYEKGKHNKNAEGEIIKTIGFTQDITKRKIAELQVDDYNNSLQTIIKASEKKIGKAYFYEMAKALEKTTKASFSFIGELINSEEIKTIALSHKGELLKNITYQLKDTPCENVIHKETCIYTQNIAELFPKDQLLVEMGVEAYVGTPIFNSVNECIGIIVSLYKKPITDSDSIKSIFEILAGKFAGEMDRQKAEELLINKNEALLAAEEELLATNNALKSNIKELEESEDRFKALHNASFGGIAIHENGEILECNLGLTELTGYSQDELIGMNGLLLINDKTRPTVVKNIKNKYQKPYEAIGLKKDGQEYPVRLEAREIPYKGRKVRVVEFRDISEQKKFEKEILDNENQLQLIFDSSPAIMFLVNEKGEILRMNKTGLNFLQTSIEQIKNNQLGDAFNCIVAIQNKEGCGSGYACKSCKFRNTLTEVITSKKIQTGTEASINIINNGAVKSLTVILSTSIASEFPEHTFLVTINDISERKKNEIELKKSEERFKDFANSITDVFFALNSELKYIFWNKASELFFKEEAKNTLGKSFYAMKFNEGFEWVAEKYKQTMKSKEPKVFEVSENKNGQSLFYLVNVFPTQNGVTVYLKNITKNKNAELALIESEKQLQLILDNSPAIMLLVNKDRDIIRMNKTGLKLTGNKNPLRTQKSPGEIFNCIYSAEKSCGKNSECQQCAFHNSISETIRTNNPQNKIETKLNVKKGNKTESLIFLISTVLISKTSSPIYLVTLEDITEQKNVAIKLEESYTKFKTLADYTYGWEYWLSPKGQYIYVSPSCERISGFSASEFYKNPELFYNQLLDSEKIIWGQHKNKALSGEIENTPLEIRFKTKKGQIIWLEHICRPVFDKNNNFLGNRGTNRDITKLKQDQFELIESKNRFKQLADITQEGIAILKNNSIIDSNKALATLTRYTSEELLGKNLIIDIIHKNHISHVKEKISNPDKTLLEIEIQTKDGQKIPVEIFIQSLSKTNKELKVILFRDITEQKQMHQKVLNAIISTEENERIRVAQELHDGLGPVLSATKLYAETFLKSDNEAFKEKAKHHLLSGIKDALHQVSTISNNLSPHVLMDFGIESAIKKFVEKIGILNQVNVNFICRIQTEISKDIEITLYRVSTELINNTLKHAKASMISLEINSKDNFVILEFMNNGISFDFHKTKEKKEGMGLFNIINRIKSFDGSVNFENLSPNGIKYHISIPLDKFN